jgi:hypothetical protein
MDAEQHAERRESGDASGAARSSHLESPTRQRVRQEVYGDGYPEAADPRSFLARTGLRRLAREPRLPAAPRPAAAGGPRPPHPTASAPATDRRRTLSGVATAEPVLLTLNRDEARAAGALFERMFPADAGGPGATEIGVLAYLDRALAEAYREHRETYRLGLQALDRAARRRHGRSFADCAPAQQDALLAALERGRLPGGRVPPQASFFDLLLAHLQEGLFADPTYGGNREKLGWKVLGHPGVWQENSAEENLGPGPADKGGAVRSLADLAVPTADGRAAPPDVPGYDPQRGAAPPAGGADVVLVGLGGMGGLVAPLLARAGLRVVALEAGPWRTGDDFVPDELGAAYYCRATMGPKFLSEAPRWRRHAGEPTREATFSLGRMMNGVGGSVVHHDAWAPVDRNHCGSRYPYVTDRDLTGLLQYIRAANDDQVRGFLPGPRPAVARQLADDRSGVGAGMAGFDKPVFVEDDGSYLATFAPAAFRRAMWESLVGGAAAYDTLDGHPEGVLPEFDSLRPRPAVLAVKGHLVRFLYERALALEDLSPQPGLVTSGASCLASPGKTGVVYFPDGGHSTVDLTAWRGSVRAEWYDPRSGQTSDALSLDAGRRVEVSCPTDDDWVLYVSAAP